MEMQKTQRRHCRIARKFGTIAVSVFACVLALLQLGAKGGCNPPDTDTDPTTTTTTTTTTTMSTGANKSIVNATTLYVRWRPEGRAMGYFEHGNEVVVHRSSQDGGYLCVTGTNKYNQEFTGWVQAEYVDVGLVDGQPCDATEKGFPLAWYRCMQVVGDAAFIRLGSSDTASPMTESGLVDESGKLEVGSTVGILQFNSDADVGPSTFSAGDFYHDVANPDYVLVSLTCEDDLFPCPRVDPKDPAPAAVGWVRYDQLKPRLALGTKGPWAYVTGSVVEQHRTVTLPPSQVLEEYVSCPSDHPFPMTGGFHVSASSERLLASGPVHWSDTSAYEWQGSDPTKRAGWRVTVANLDVQDHGFEVYLDCRRGAIPEKPQNPDQIKPKGPFGIVELASTASVGAAGTGETDFVKACKSSPNDETADFRVPWVAGFNLRLDSAPVDAVKNRFVLISQPQGWDAGTGTGVSWFTRVRNNGGLAYQARGAFLCGLANKGPVCNADKLKTMTVSTAVPPANGGTAVAECPKSHPVPIAGGVRPNSTYMVATVSKPLGWDTPQNWQGPDGSRARWYGTADNLEPAGGQSHGLDTFIVCRAPRSGDF